jgi:hypothetical protein
VSGRLGPWFRILCKFGIPLILAILVGSLLMDRLNRWPVAESVLTKYPDQSAVMVGFHYRFAGDDWTRSATYLLFPSRRSITITVINGAAPLVTESPYGLFGVAMTLFWIAVAVGLSLWHWRRTPAAPQLHR